MNLGSNRIFWGRKGHRDRNIGIPYGTPLRKFFLLFSYNYLYYLNSKNEYGEVKLKFIPLNSVNSDKQSLEVDSCRTKIWYTTFFFKLK